LTTGAPPFIVAAMNKTTPEKSFSLPLSPQGTLIIIDRDATIISSREIAYGCYRAAFDRVIRKSDSEAGQLGEELFSRAYHPFSRIGVYEVYYCREPKFNRLIPGMDGAIRALKAAGGVIVILTASESDGSWLKHYRIPVDGLFSVQRLKKDGIIEGGKPEAIHHILDQYGASPRAAVTIGDNPQDHIDEVISIGTPFGLACPDARRDLEKAVDIYIPRLENLYRIFNLIPAPPPAGTGNRKDRRR